ncbi:DsbA family protein [Actinokineospora sp. UTMC 2448]|uniref:DsbA family protein n=1 Tax=Actinokineospora sp. UTMC 2448 TaxID=2268449 RepID=UPI002164AE8D|nr:DsbA family protein [Actinokineospora sp. UTMC 2448]UVS77350.1 Serine/threonine-protein kinase PknE [Actinokineospora sp. UTMC 2448]
MGGAERNQRKRRQAQQAAPPPVATARKAPVDGKRIAIAVAVVIAVGAIIAGFVYSDSVKNATEGESIAVVPSTLDVPVSRDGAVVTVGRDDARVTIDVYEDFLCPACRSFEEEHGDDIERAVADGDARVRYHLINLLAERSDPPGYSTDAATAALLAADAGVFPAFHKSLFAAQPDEDARGWDREQLIALGAALGATDPAFADGVRSGALGDVVAAEYERARTTDSLLRDRGGERLFATPTVAADGVLVDTADDAWLAKLLG